MLFIFTIYHHGFFHSVRRNPSLNCLHRRRSLAILGHEGPRWWIRLSLHLVLGLPCRLFHSRGVHSVTLFVHLLSLNRAMCPAHPCIPFLITSMISITPVWCRIQVLRLWSRRVMRRAWCAPFCAVRLTVVPCEPSSVPMSHCRTPWLVTRIHCVPSSLHSY